MPKRGETMVTSQAAYCSQWSRTSVLKDVTFLACTESWWEFERAKARSSGVIVKGESVCGVETKPTSFKQDQT